MMNVPPKFMHAYLSVTDGVYGILSETDVRKQISKLGNMPATTNDDVYEVLEMLLAQHKKNTG